MGLSFWSSQLNSTNLFLDISLSEPFFYTSWPIFCFLRVTTFSHFFCLASLSPVPWHAVREITWRSCIPWPAWSLATSISTMQNSACTSCMQQCISVWLYHFSLSTRISAVPAWEPPFLCLPPPQQLWGPVLSQFYFWVRVSVHESFPKTWIFFIYVFSTFFPPFFLSPQKKTLHYEIPPQNPIPWYI